MLFYGKYDAFLQILVQDHSLVKARLVLKSEKKVLV